MSMWGRAMIFDTLPLLAAAPLGVWDVLWDILVLLSMALLLESSRYAWAKA